VVTKYTAGRISKLAEEDWPGDELVGAWSREALIAMDEKFRRAMTDAIERGLERRPDGEAPERAA
jgi:hypothetical protein